MDNKAIAGILYETADLLEIDGQDSFRIRSYRNAAEAIEAQTQQIADLIDEPKKVLAIPGIGKGMLLNLQEMFKEGKLSLHAELLKKYHPSMLDLLKIQGLGPKTIALIWSAYQVSDVDGVAKLAKEGKIRELPRMGEKQEQKLLKAIEDYRRIAGRFLLDAAEQQADKIIEHLRDYPGVEKVTPAGSLRRGRETVGDLDILVTGKACCYDGARQDLIDHIIKLPGLMEIIARGDNKISFRLRGRHAGGCAPSASGLLRRRHAVFHRFEGPQCGPAPARAEDGIHPQRVQSGQTSIPKSRSREKPRKRFTPGSSSITFRPSCAKISVKSTPPRPIPCPI